MDEFKTKILVLFLIPLILYISLLPVMPLMEPDEGRYSAIPREMNQSGDYVTPHLKGVVYFEKPPLCYWSTAALFRVFGENEFSSRLFAALCAWGCILLVYRVGAFFHDRKTGIYSAAVLSTALYHVALGRINILDMPLAFFVSMAIWSGFRYFSGNTEKKGWLSLFYLFSALAFLAKGLIGPVFPGAIIVVWLIWSGRWRESFKIFSPMGMVIFIALTLPWLILVQNANPDFFWFFFVQEHFLRYTTAMHSRNEPIYYFIPIVIAGIIPWLGFLPQALRGLKSNIASLFNHSETRFLLIWGLFIFLFFSVSSSKLIPYIAPVFLPIAVFLGHIFRCYDERVENNTTQVQVFADFIPVLLQTLILVTALFATTFIGTQRMPFSSWWPWVVLPIAFLLFMAIVPEVIRRKRQRGWFLSAYLLSVAFFAALIFPASHFLTPYKSAYPIAQAVKQYLPPNKVLYQYNMSLYGVDFYTKMRTPIVDDIGELSFGVLKAQPEEKSRYFLTSPEFFKFFHGGQDIYCVTEGAENLSRLYQEAPALHILWDNGRFYLVHLTKAALHQGKD